MNGWWPWLAVRNYGLYVAPRMCQVPPDENGEHLQQNPLFIGMADATQKQALVTLAKQK